MTSAPSLGDPEGIHNFRVLAPYRLRGGGHIRANMVYRSGALELMTGDDSSRLADDIGVTTILDLRHPEEWGGGATTHALAERVVPLSIFPEEQVQADLIAELNGLYGNGPSPRRYLHYLQIGGTRFADAFRLLAKPESYPVLVHCTAGKDRTGVVLGMLMDLLGAFDEDIAHEYALSDASIERLIAFLESTGRVLEGTREEIRARLATPPERMAGFIELLRETHGSAAAYLQSQGVTAAELETIRQTLTDPA